MPADAKKYSITRAERINQPDEGINVLRLWLMLDDGTHDYIEIDSASPTAVDDLTDGASIDDDIAEKHTGGPLMAVGSLDMTGTVVT